MFVELLIGRVSRMTGNHPRYPRRPVRGSLGFSEAVVRHIIEAFPWRPSALRRREEQGISAAGDWACNVDFGRKKPRPCITQKHDWQEVSGTVAWRTRKAPSVHEGDDFVWTLQGWIGISRPLGTQPYKFMCKGPLRGCLSFLTWCLWSRVVKLGQPR